MANDNGAPIDGAQGAIVGTMDFESSPAYGLPTAGRRIFSFLKGDNMFFWNAQSLLGAAGPELSARQIRKRSMVLDMCWRYDIVAIV